MSNRSYAVEHRLRMIDFLLVQYGQINRAALVDYFGVSMPQASRDFQDYMEIAPGNMEYSGVDKVYKRTDAFKRVWA